jgi:hypothetical protein
VLIEDINGYTRGYQILVACCSEAEAGAGGEAKPRK